ncbi:MAG: anti-sigma factor [Myxococcales bacterium]
MKMDALELMSLVLDGEATPQQGRELEQLLATDPKAAAEFAALRVLFGQLERVPQLGPPAGLAGPALQRFQSFPRNPAAKGRTMDPKARKSTLWIGIGAAAAAAVIAGVLLVQWPPDAKNAQGTIVPAQRYRAEQIKAEDVKLGDQAVTQLMQSDAFERAMKDPQIRALAADANFQALARSGVLDAAFKNADAFVTNAKAVAAGKEAAATQVAQAKAVAAGKEASATQVAQASLAARASADAVFRADATRLDAHLAAWVASHADAFLYASRQADFASLAAAQGFADAVARFSADAAAANSQAR